MTINQANKRAMFGRIAAVINQHIVFFAGLAAFASAFEHFQNLLEEIDSAADEKSGELKIRDASEEMLINALMEVAPALCSYAKKAKLPDVKSEACITRSELEHLALIDLGQKAKALAELAGRYAALLGPHGADTHSVAKMNVALSKFLSAAALCSEGPKMNLTHAITSLRNLFQSADTVLSEQLDTMVETLKRKHPEFYREYRAAREVCSSVEQVAAPAAV